MRVYLADLGHNQLTLSSDVFPLGIANLMTYAQANAGLREPLDITLFREPQDLKAALDAESPHVLGLSSYSWNHQLSLHFARYAKARNPDTLTIMGGPNFPLIDTEQEMFVRNMPEIDVAVRGPTYEGERAFVNLIRRFSEVGHALAGLQEEPVPGSLWVDRKTGDFARGGEVERIRDLDDIPSPYLSGLLDHYFTTGYFPLLQIARGCPFTCAFCNSSVQGNSKIFRHSVENVKADLLYVAQRVRPETTLCFADDNFAMYEEDEEIAEYLGWLQDHYNWPRYVRTTTGKNRHDRIIRAMSKARGILPITAAVQSLNPEVLKNIKRSNIKLETYTKLQQEAQANGMQTYGELIIGLPGETKASFMQAVHDLLESGVKRVSAHQLMLLPGAPLSNLDTRQFYGFRTRFRVVARNIGDYTGVPVVETEEMVVETPTFGFEDYLETRIFHLLVTVYYYEGNYEEAFEFARQQGIKAFDLIRHLQSMLREAPSDLKKVINDFLQESQDELFDTKEECIAWARRNFDGLVDGTIGGNLLSKYSLFARFYKIPETLDFLEAGIRSMLGESSDLKDTQLRAVIEYLRCVQLQAPFGQSLGETPRWTATYDVDTWRADSYGRNLEEYHYPRPRDFVAVVDPGRKSLIQSRIATFGEHPTQLGKFTRTMFATDLRRTLIPVEEEAAVGTGVA